MSSLLIALLIFATLWLGALALLLHRTERELVGVRLRDIEGLRSLRESRLSLPFYQRAFAPLVTSSTRMIMRLSPQNAVAAVRRELTMAGRRQADPLAWIFHKWIGAALLGGIALAVGLLRHWPISTLLVATVAWGGIAYLWPELNIRRAIRLRQARIVKDLPDTLDLLTISVEAGLGLDQALEVVTSRRPGPLSDEIRVYLDEVRLGADRSEVLKAIGTRSGVEELISFTFTLVQAVELGVSIAKVLREQSHDVRTQRRQRIEERAMKATVKLLFPLIFLILPALFVVVAGPGLIRAYTEFLGPQRPGTLGAPPGVPAR